MPAIHGVVQKLHAGVEFCRASRVLIVEQARVAANLAQLRELGENLELVLLKLLWRVLVLQLQRQPVLVGLVQLVLFASHARIYDTFVFLWQICQHVGLESAQDKRGDHALQPMCRVALAGLHGSGEALGERIHAAQDARHKEVEDAPQLDEAVLDGRARERQASVGLQTFYRFGHLGAGVLDVMGFVEHRAREANVCIRLDIALEQVVGRHEHVMGGCGANHCDPYRFGADHGCGIELRGEAGELRHPVIHE